MNMNMDDRFFPVIALRESDTIDPDSKQKKTIGSITNHSMAFYRKIT